MRQLRQVNVLIGEGIPSLGTSQLHSKKMGGLAAAVLQAEIDRRVGREVYGAVPIGRSDGLVPFTGLCAPRTGESAPVQVRVLGETRTMHFAGSSENPARPAGPQVLGARQIHFSSLARAFEPAGPVEQQVRY